MSDIHIRTEGCAGRITLNRPKALNALTYDMIRAIEAALLDWRGDAQVTRVIFDAMGEKAFCAGGDIADLYRTGRAGDFAYGQAFWADEYRLNALIAGYSKPTISFLQGFTMGGGVGIGCHCATRVVSGQSVIAMPECGIGLVPDVGGSLILARAPGHLGAWLGTTTHRLEGHDAIYAGFADHLIEADGWDEVKRDLTAGADPALPGQMAEPPPDTSDGLPQLRERIDPHFANRTLPAILASLRSVPTDDPAAREFANATLAAMARNSPLSMACTVDMQARLRSADATIEDALRLEYRFTARAMEHGDFLEGIRAAIIDKDRAPRWKHRLDEVTETQVSAMLAPLEKELFS